MQQLFDLSGKVAAITGAGSGIGRAIATLFGRQGARVVALDRDEAAARETADAIAAASGNADAQTCDVSNARQVADVFDQIGRDLEAKAGLPDATRAGQRHQACVRLAQ